MSSTDETNDDALVEECIEELDGLFMALDRYPPTAVAVAIATYLEGLPGRSLTSASARPTRCASFYGRLRRVSSNRRARLKNRAPGIPRGVRAYAVSARCGWCIPLQHAWRCCSPPQIDSTASPRAPPCIG
jgi:hypothetical protein